LEFKIKEFKEEKKAFENIYNSLNDRANSFKSEINSNNKARENLNLNKALFTILNTNSLIGQTDQQIEDNIRSKYIDKTYITIPQKQNSIVLRKEIIEKNTTMKEKLMLSKQFNNRYLSPNKIDLKTDKRMKTNIITKVKTELKTNKKINKFKEK
jgi:hypothetical protein